MNNDNGLRIRDLGYRINGHGFFKKDPEFEPYKHILGSAR